MYFFNSHIYSLNSQPLSHSYKEAPSLLTHKPIRSKPLVGDRFIPRAIPEAFNDLGEEDVVGRTAYQRELINATIPQAVGTVFEYNDESYNKRLFTNRYLENAPVAETAKKVSFPKLPLCEYDAEDIADDYCFRIADLWDKSLVIQRGNMINVKRDITREESDDYTKLAETDQCTSVAWHDQRTVLVGEKHLSGNSVVSMYDVETRNISTGCIIEKSGNIICMLPKDAGTFLVGTEDGGVAIFDRRERSLVQWSEISSVYSLAVRRDTIFSAGTYDGGVNFFDMRMFTAPLNAYSHNGTAKGCSFHPVKSHLLASSGMYDQTIKIFDMDAGTVIQSEPLESRNYGIAWECQGEYLFANQGDPLNSINIFEFTRNNLTLVDRIEKAHEARIAHCANSRPVDELYVTASGDETIKVWQMPSMRKKPQETKSLAGRLQMGHHR